MISVYGEGEILDISRPGQPHETSLLTLNIDQAKEELGWGRYGFFLRSTAIICQRQQLSWNII